MYELHEPYFIGDKFFGYVYNRPGFGDGDGVYVSTPQSYDQVTGVLTTKNSKYKLVHLALVVEQQLLRFLSGV